MKIKLTVLTENNIPSSVLNGVDEEILKRIWQAWFDMILLAVPPENEDKATVLSAEILEDE